MPFSVKTYRTCGKCTGVNGSHTALCEENTGDQIVCWQCGETVPAHFAMAWGANGSRCLHHGDVKMKIEDIARVTHEANRAYCLALGDTSQVPWDEAPAWQRDSAIAGVKAVLDGSATSPQAQHEQWYNLKAKEGWVYGPVKDANRKTHPCMVPYDRLPPEQQAKDHLFRAVVVALQDSVTV